MAEVFLAREPQPVGEPRTVVIKRMLPHIAAEPDAERMFEEEARLGGLIDHPNVVRVLGTGETDGQPYLVLEHVRGTDLATVARWASEHGEQLPLEVSLLIVCDLLDALQSVHEATAEDGAALEIVHGDVSPSNVLVSSQGEVKLADFGIAEARLRESFPQAAAVGPMRGKLGYLAPEQVRGVPHDRRADVFAASVVATELLVGRPLFGRGSDLSILLAVREAKVDPLLGAADDLPPGLLDLLLKGLAREPQDRFGSARTMRLALEAFVPEPTRTLRERLARFVEEASGVARELGDEPITSEVSELITQEPPLDDYVVERTDGSSSPPMTFAQLVEGVSTGHIGSSDRIRIGDGPSRKLRDIGELSGHVPRRVKDAEGDDVPMGGPFLDAFARSMAQGANGVWICRRQAIRKEVYLIDGVPEFVNSNLRSELLGEFLVSQGILERHELDMALAVLPRFDGRLGDTLAALGLIGPVELFRHIAAQVREKLLELFTWEAGMAELQLGARPADRYFPLGLDPWKVLADGIQRRLGMGLEQATFAEHLLDDVVGTRRAPPDGLPDDVQYVLDLVARGRKPLQEVVAALEAPGDLDRHRPYRAVRMALALDLVRFGA